MSFRWEIAALTFLREFSIQIAINLDILAAFLEIQRSMELSFQLRQSIKERFGQTKRSRE